MERARGWRRFRDWLDAMTVRGVSPNIDSFLGGGTLRQYVKGLAMAPCALGSTILRCTYRRDIPLANYFFVATMM